MTRKYDDWTGNVVPEATVRSLDPSAVRAVRATYESLHRDSDEIISLDDEAFLTKVGFFKRGKVTMPHWSCWASPRSRSSHLRSA